MLTILKIKEIAVRTGKPVASFVMGCLPHTRKEGVKSSPRRLCREQPVRLLGAQGVGTVSRMLRDLQDLGQSNCCQRWGSKRSCWDCVIVCLEERRGSGPGRHSSSERNKRQEEAAIYRVPGPEPTVVGGPGSIPPPPPFANWGSGWTIKLGNTSPQKGKNMDGATAGRPSHEEDTVGLRLRRVCRWRGQWERYYQERERWLREPIPEKASRRHCSSEWTP